MPVAIKIPVRTHISSFGASIVKLQRTVEEMCNCDDPVISLDFSDTRILNPFYLGGLVCVINRLTAEGKQITLNHDSNHFIRSYLSTIYFPACLVPQQGAYSLAYYSKKTYLPIIKLPTGAAQPQELAREKVLSAVTDLFKSQLSLSGNDLAPMAYLVSELSNNIRDHSGMDNGYVFAQYYPQSSYLDLCICDAGKGIFESFTNNPNHHPNTELEAVKFALNGRSTKNAHVLCQKVVRVGCLPVAGQPAVDDEYVSQGSSQCHRGGKSRITSANNDDLVLFAVCHLIECCR